MRTCPKSENLPNHGDFKLLLQMYYPDLISGFLAELVADVVLYPIETVIHRLHVQVIPPIIMTRHNTRRLLCFVRFLP